MKYETHPSMATAICEAVAEHLCASLIATTDAVADIVQERRVNEAIVGMRKVEGLTAEELVRYQRIIGQKTGDRLAAAARISRDALTAPAGHRTWLSAVHDAACALFHRAMVDYTDGRACDPLRLLTAQTILIATVHAVGVLGLPANGEAKRRPTAIRELDPGDYPDPAVRRAIVEAAFNEDADSIALLRARSCQTTSDMHGRISLLLAALADDDDRRLHVRYLAGRILAEEPEAFSVTIKPVLAQPPPVTPAALIDRARDLARSL